MQPGRAAAHLQHARQQTRAAKAALDAVVHDRPEAQQRFASCAVRAERTLVFQDDLVEFQAEVFDNSSGVPGVPSESPVTAAFSWAPATAIVGVPVVFTARVGSDYGNPTTFEWDFPGEVKKTGQEVQFTFRKAGPQLVHLRVTREDTAIDGISMSVPVSAAVSRHL